MLSATQYDDYAWWDLIASDFECCPVTSAVALINDGNPITHVLYPAVTLYNIQAFILRVVAGINSNYDSIYHLDSFNNIKDVFAMLDQATHVTRLSVLPTMMVFALLMYFLFYYLLKDKIFACLWTLFLITEPHILYYNFVMRAEIFGVIFFFLLFFLSILFFRNANERISLKRCVLYFISFGLLAGWSLFSKIQIFPALGFYMILMFYYLFTSNNKPSLPKIGLTPQATIFCFVNAVINVIIYPWWTMARPDYVTPELLSRWPWSDLYGPPPGKESFASIPLTVLIVLLIISLVYVFVARNKRTHTVIQGVFPIILFVNLMFSGAILSVYTACLGGFVSLSSYLANTHSFVYATFTNFYFAGQMDYNVFGFENFQRYYKEFNSVPFFIFTFLQVILAGFLWALVQTIRRGTRNKIIYVFGLLAISLGFAFDLLATLRASLYMFNYGIYSVCFYVLGLVLIFAVELRRIKEIRIRMARMSILVLIAVIFVAHIFPLKAQYEEKGVRRRLAGAERDYKIIFDHCYWQSSFFWNMVDRGLYHSEDFKEVREVGRNFSWGHENQQIIRMIKERDQTHQLLTQEDKIGKIDELILKYTYNLKYRIYMYNYLMETADQLQKKSQVNLALMNYTNATKVLPHLAEAYQKRGVLYARMQQYGKGLSDIEKAKGLGAEVDPAFLEKLQEASRQD